MEYLNRFSKKGQTLIELLLAVGLAALLIPALLSGFMSSRDSRVQQTKRVDALAHLTELKSVVRSVREMGWSYVSTNGVYHPVASGSAWAFAAGTETIDGITRSVSISDVNRDTSGTIVSDGGALDPSTKKITLNITWTAPYPTSTSSILYLTRWLENAAYTETTQAHFNAGAKSGVVVQATNPPQTADDGEVILGAGGFGNWCAPTLLSPGTNLEGQGIAKDIYAVEGKAYTGTGENSSGNSLIGINISNAHPPVASQQSAYDGHKTNSVHGETNYGYISTDTNGKEVVIVQTSSTPYTEIGYFDAPGGNSGRSVYVVGNTGYVTTGDKLYNFDLSSKTGSRPIRDSNGVQLAGNGSQVVVSGNYAYVSIEGNSSTEMQIVDVSNATNLMVVGQADIDGQSARDIYINTSASRAYIAAQEDSGRRELFIVDISTKTGSRPIVGSYDTNGMDPRGIVVVPGNRAIMVGWNAEEYQVVDISNEAASSRCGGLQVPTGVNGVASVLEADGDAYSYIVTQDTDAEFRIVEGGPGGGAASSGTFESQTFDPGYLSANNRLRAIFAKPPSTDIQFQVSLATKVAGVCPATGSYTFVGPDGTSGSYFTQSSGQAIAFPYTNYQTYTNPGQCLRYKVYFSTSDQANTPVLNDVTINYSP